MRPDPWIWSRSVWPYWQLHMHTSDSHIHLQPLSSACAAPAPVLAAPPVTITASPTCHPTGGLPSRTATITDGWWGTSATLLPAAVVASYIQGDHRWHLPGASPSLADPIFPGTAAAPSPHGFSSDPHRFQTPPWMRSFVSLAVMLASSLSSKVNEHDKE